MIAIKVIANARFASNSASTHFTFLTTATNTSLTNRKHLIKLARQFNRSLVSSTSQQQQITNTNNQQLIPIARNIFFRQCQNNANSTSPTSSNPAHSASYSIASQTYTVHPYATTVEHANIFGYPQTEETPILVDDDNKHTIESPLNKLKRKARGAFAGHASSTSEGNAKFYGQIFNRAVSTSQTDEKKLVVLMSWLDAREKHIEKYRQYYLDKGYDVLNVKTSPFDLLLPTIGAKKISKDFVKFLVHKQYSNVVMHGFSVGGYQFGEFLLELDQREPIVREKITNSIKGIVFDSLVPIEGFRVGVANSVSRNKFVAKLIESILRLYMVLAHNIATKYYLKASEKVWSGPIKCPSLFFLSKDDIVSDYTIIKRLSEVWKKQGIEIQRVEFDNSPHVQHFHTHNETYTSKLQQFLEYIKPEENLANQIQSETQNQTTEQGPK